LKLSLFLLTFITLISFSANAGVPDYTGKWVAIAEGGGKWTLKIDEMAFEKPVDAYPGQNDSKLNAHVSALLKYNSKEGETDPMEIIYNLAGSRLDGDGVFTSHTRYELGHPIATNVLKFNIPNNNSEGFIAWLEYSYVGLIYSRMPKEFNHSVTKLHFKRVD